MDFSYTILILLLPVVIFLFTGLFGSKMNPRVSGLLGTTGLLVITLLSYLTAYSYFSNSTGD